ncbi:MAG: OmpA family protein [Chitinophagaceae bacterium]|jgi:chemotaxis protein MotB|nr:OmpA family protein [Chitinophagaceae bacterium]
MKSKFFVLPLVMVVTLFSCVSSKKFQALTGKYGNLNNQLIAAQMEAKACRDEKAEADRQRSIADAQREAQIGSLKDQIEFLKKSSNQTLKQLEDLSVISSSQAESIKKSLDNIGSKDAYIQTIQSAAARKDSMNMALVMNLKGAIGDLNDQDVNIKVDKGVVYVDISDKVLFKTGSFDLGDRAKTVLGKVALVLKNQPDIEFMVEGHTDNVAMKGDKDLMDNWDLSVKRATTIVRLLQKQYDMNPAQMVAAGRAEFRPLADNSTETGRAANRRTRIVILPQLDQFFKLLEKR